MKVVRFEKSPLESPWDSKSRRTLSELSVFFPAWSEHKSLRALSTEVFWIGSASPRDLKWPQLRAAVLEEILSDPLCRVSDSDSAMPPEARAGHHWWCLEKQLRAGVTDNAGHVLAEAVRLVTGFETECRSGSRLWLELPRSVGVKEVRAYADQVFHNALIERVETWSEQDAKDADAALFREAAWPVLKSEPSKTLVELIEITRLELNDLEKLSGERLWALSRDELSCIQSHYQRLGRAMTDVEIEVLAQTWSEHCKHKIFAANIDVTNERDDIELPRRVESVFKTYIRGATRDTPAPYLRSVFEDNAGVISINDEIDCAIKVETHNSPSALDPYGGALTGIVGVNRDILGVGLGAHPIANLDVFCVGPLDVSGELPPRLHHPRRILEGVRVGVEHGGNKSGIPTVTGAVVHHPGYLGKPLIFCGTIGILPTHRDFIRKEIFAGDKIVMVGGRIGKDGIHGATFSSLEMNEDSPVSAVQLGDPLTQRRVWDFLIEARDLNLFRAVTDNGAGGLSSSIGELARLCGAKGGARMDVAHAKTKYEGLVPYELVVSESQERMSFAVPPEKLEKFLNLALRRGVECSVLGDFEDSGRFHILYQGETVADLDMHFLHEGLPAMELKARVSQPKGFARQYGVWQSIDANSLEAALPAILAHPNVRSRREITQQYDHEVQARGVRTPYGTPEHAAPNDGATLRLSRKTYEGVAVGLGIAPFAADIDPKVAAELALDEALRNAAVAGMDPAHAALVDNFCWPDPTQDEEKLGALVVTCKRIYDGAVTLRMPFISGKDSMKNDYRMGGVKISVPPTLLVTAMGKVHDVRKVPKGYAVSKPSGSRRVLWVSGQDIAPNALGLPRVDFSRASQFLAAFHQLVREGCLESAHDVSDGGWLGATSEMLFGTGVGARLNLELKAREGEPQWASLFAEPATSFVLFVREEDSSLVKSRFSEFVVLDVGVTIPGSPLLELTAHVVDGGKHAARWRIADLERAYGVRT